MARGEDLTGRKINEWEVLAYAGNSTYVCKCSCGAIKAVKTQYLKNGKSKSCGHNTTRFKDLTGQHFGEWEVIEYEGKQKWKCRCSCGEIRSVEAYYLVHGKSKSCGHNNPNAVYNASKEFKDITGQQFGEWKALEYKGNSMWLCRCSCGKEKEVHRYSLISGTSKSCGHLQRIDLRGKRFGRLVPIENIGDNKWRCQCDCGNTTDVYAHNLKRINGTRSCGCINIEKKPNKEFIIDKINEYIEHNGEKPYIHNLQLILDREETAVRGYIKEYKLEEYMNFTYRSKEEYEIYSLLKNAKLSDRTEIYPYEIDILTEDRKTGIEFNGSYWHSDKFKDKYYHYNKTKMCNTKGIHLIHIFEYEWSDNRKKNILKNMIKYIDRERTKIYARNTYIKEIKSSEAKEFLENNHLQGYVNASITIGCFSQDKNELLGVMSFGKPRFNNEYEYELYRLCWRADIKVIGGSEKIFKSFLDKYNPKSIITYSDISKFSGNVYETLGFDYIKNTEPNYVWVEPYTNEIITRYQAQKHKLLEQGLGTEDQTEDDIMHNLGFEKIYDCGNRLYTINIERKQ